MAFWARAESTGVKMMLAAGRSLDGVGRRTLAIGVGKLVTEDVEEPAAAPGSSRDDLLRVHSVLSPRRIAYDTLMWQVPALALAAQAFLLTVAVKPETAEWARYLTACLSFLVAIVAIQTMDKSRACEVTDSRWLEEIETRLGLTLNEVAPHSEPAKRATATDRNAFENSRWLAIPSHCLWKVTLALFGLGAIGVIVLTAFFPDLLNPQ